MWPSASMTARPPMDQMRRNRRRLVVSAIAAPATSAAVQQAEAISNGSPSSWANAKNDIVWPNRFQLIASASTGGARRAASRTTGHQGRYAAKRAAEKIGLHARKRRAVRLRV